MKNLTLWIVIAIAASVLSCDQNKEGNTPEQVKAAFAEKFPEVKEAEWERENETEWEAEFDMDGKEYSANFTNKGEWMETEYAIKASDISEDIHAILATNFSDFEIEEAEIVETPQGQSYEFEIEQGETEYEVAIDANGNLTKKEQREEEDEYDED
ncbi:PepSY-like domain-containing protein [Reichenbachiella carrageenanivorans]|uniref:PepSY-like domain-containing protein n=1 Tax=Reichenbachiella carrageenanivorans TaxID=2979869 RepID=A0ABY6CXN7_9BACT|nr:PepSY-like domain-containing protein [Reichenbachiella carrageenanivorans]UXX78687.1 PepSY-like domain-containing protein [Reichenbachiella carrageenanivorans]